MLENDAKGSTTLNLFLDTNMKQRKLCLLSNNTRVASAAAILISAILGVAVKSPYLVCNIFALQSGVRAKQQKRQTVYLNLE